MNRNQNQNEEKKKTPPAPLKPKHPDTKGAPNDKDPQAQYEDKDES